MAGKSPSQPDPAIATLLKQCRQDGGAGYVGKIIRKVGQDDSRDAFVLADQEWAYAVLVTRRSEVMRYLRVDNVLIQKEIQDPLVVTAIALGGFVVARR